MGKQAGFTLVELLISIVLLAILLALAVPSFQSFVKNNRVTAQTNGLVSAIQMARSEALKRGTNSVICASDNGEDCTGNGTWASGWIVFSDLNADGDPNVGGSDPLCEETEDCILLVSDGLSGENTLTADSDKIRFLPNGLTGPGAWTAELKLISYDCEKNQARRIFVTLNGHTIVTKVGCT
jgi:type IV fimbrial biogenesis protein FimT